MPPTDSYLVFDVETTGLNPRTDRIIQVGLCKVCDGVVTERSGWLVNQEVEVPPAARMIHGITTADIRARGIAPRDSLARLFESMATAPTSVGHNIHQFDILFLYAECRRLGMSAPTCTHFIDTAAIFKGRKLGMPKKPEETASAYADRVFSIRAPGLRYSIPTCIAELGIKASTARLHDASHDAYVTHLIFQILQRPSDLPIGLRAHQH
ncbi:MAG: 3'-5' exonuclease [Planctomycetota bacterium]